MYSANSLRGRGLTCIAIDKPTRARLKLLASREGVTLAEYLRVLATRESQNSTLPLSSEILPVSGVTPAELKAELQGVSKAICLVLEVLGVLAKQSPESRFYLKDSVAQALREISRSETGKQVEFGLIGQQV